MEIVALVALCIGSALGLRFQVFIMLPATATCVAVITVVALSQGSSIGTISVLNVIGAVCLQFGYLGGTLLWSWSSAGRLREAKNSQAARIFTR